MLLKLLANLPQQWRNAKECLSPERDRLQSAVLPRVPQRKLTQQRVHVELKLHHAFKPAAWPVVSTRR